MLKISCFVTIKSTANTVAHTSNNNEVSQPELPVDTVVFLDSFVATERGLKVADPETEAGCCFVTTVWAFFVLGSMDFFTISERDEGLAAERACCGRLLSANGLTSLAGIGLIVCCSSDVIATLVTSEIILDSITVLVFCFKGRTAILSGFCGKNFRSDLISGSILETSDGDEITSDNDSVASSKPATEIFPFMYTSGSGSALNIV